MAGWEFSAVVTVADPETGLRVPAADQWVEDAWLERDVEAQLNATNVFLHGRLVARTPQPWVLAALEVSHGHRPGTEDYHPGRTFVRVKDLAAFSAHWLQPIAAEAARKRLGG